MRAALTPSTLNLFFDDYLVAHYICNIAVCICTHRLIL